MNCKLIKIEFLCCVLWGWLWIKSMFIHFIWCELNDNLAMHWIETWKTYVGFFPRKFLLMQSVYDYAKLNFNPLRGHSKVTEGTHCLCDNEWLWKSAKISINAAKTFNWCKTWFWTLPAPSSYPRFQKNRNHPSTHKEQALAS